jgi:cell division topological specificity factor
MSIFSFFGNKPEKKSAAAAKDRLQIMIARERSSASEYDFMPDLEREIIALIAKYIKVSVEDIKISMDRTGDIEVLDVNVTLPPMPQPS